MNRTETDVAHYIRNFFIQLEKKKERKHICLIWQRFRKEVLGRAVAMISVCACQRRRSAWMCLTVITSDEHTHFFQRCEHPWRSGSHLALPHLRTLCWVYSIMDANNNFWIWLAFFLDISRHFWPLAGAVVYVIMMHVLILILFLIFFPYCQSDQIN